LGFEADRGGTRVCTQHGAALAGRGRLARVCDGVAFEEAGRIVRLDRRAVSPPCRQCRCGSPGAGEREEPGCQLADGRTRDRPLRRELVAAARATLRFETHPGEQLQIDFGERRVEIGGVAVKVFFFVATLGYSRRLHVRTYGHERQDSWFDGLESALRAFGGVPGEVLLDNAKALILHHDPASREVVLHPRLHAFARHWGFRIRACAPYRARTKGKDERGVGYVKRNAIAGRRFASWSAMEAHLEAWTREIADTRVHGTTGETPRERFERDEAAALRSPAGIPPFMTARELLRRVGADCAIEVDGNAYSVPWRLIGERVRVSVGSGSVRVLHAGREVAVHAELKGRHGRSTDDQHLVGIAGTPGRPIRLVSQGEAPAAEAPSALLRPLADYEAAIGGGF
jgi:Integrase core domain